MSIVHEWKLLVFANKIRTNRNTCLLNEAEITSKNHFTKKNHRLARMVSKKHSSDWSCAVAASLSILR